MESRRGAWGLEESQCHSSLQKGQEGGPRNLHANQLHLHPWKGDGTAHPGGHLKACGGKKKVIVSSQHEFTKGKSCLPKVIAFYNGMTGWVDKGRAVDVSYLGLSEAFYLSPITCS